MVNVISQYKIYFYAAAIVIAMAAVTGTVLYINHLKSENKDLTQSVATLQTSVDTQKETIKVLVKDITTIKEVNKSVDAVKVENNKKLQELDKKFNGNAKPFSQIAYENTQLVEDAINKATVEKLRCFELLTGQKAEKNENNSMCPDYLN